MHETLKNKVKTILSESNDGEFLDSLFKKVNMSDGKEVKLPTLRGRLSEMRKACEIYKSSNKFFLVRDTDE